MVQINGKDYVTVAERLALLHDQYDNVMIETEILRFDEEIVLVKAVLKIEEKQFIGHAQEIIGSSQVNSTSALENAETSAVGRALAFCGITNDSIASAEEVAAAIEQQDKKIQTALKALNAISHAGNFQKWISDNKTFLADLKSKNPVSYNSFLVKFTEIKNQLKSNGVIK